MMQAQQQVQLTLQDTLELKRPVRVAQCRVKIIGLYNPGDWMGFPGEGHDLDKAAKAVPGEADSRSK